MKPKGCANAFDDVDVCVDVVVDAAAAVVDVSADVCKGAAVDEIGILLSQWQPGLSLGATNPRILLLSGISAPRIPKQS